jgi:hypothetical protein
MRDTYKEIRYILLTGTEFVVQNVSYLSVWLGSFVLSVFYRLGVSSHESRVPPQYRPSLPTPNRPPPPPILSLTQLFPPRSAARNYGTNLAPFVLLQVAPPNSILYYTLISTKSSNSQIRMLISTFRSNRNCFYTQHFDSPVGF